MYLAAHSRDARFFPYLIFKITPSKTADSILCASAAGLRAGELLKITPQIFVFQLKI
tara:strand:+ start:180 stop:350 length:171 start_codon:yes stop_codon:yes gene_type:complete